MPRVLMLPSDYGGGMGHVARCIYLGNKLKRAGVEVAIILGKKHLSVGREAGLNTFQADVPLERLRKISFRPPFLAKNSLETSVSKPPVFVEFNGLAFQVPRDNYLNENVVNARFRRLCRIFEQFRPDLLIGDGHFLAHLLGKFYQTPVCQITRSIAFPPAPNFLWWKEPDSRIIPPNGLKPFYPLLNKLKLSDYEKSEDLLKGDKYLIPSCDLIEPIPEKLREEVIYAGPMIEYPIQQLSSSLFPVKEDFPKIYVTIGGGARRGQEKAFFDTILSAFKDQPFNVLVSTACRIPSTNYQNAARNVKFTNWLQGMAAIRECDLVIFHGGYNTLCEVLLVGKPSIVIPSHSEQEGNGRRIESLGVGKLLELHNGDLQPFKFTWTYGQYQMLAGFDFALSPHDLLSATEQLLSGCNLKNLKKISSTLQQLNLSFDETQLLV